MAEDVEEEVGHVSDTAGGDIDEVLLLAGLSIGIIFILALIFDYRSLAGLGVGLVSSLTSPVTAGGNGLGQLITAFFDGLAKRITNMGLFILGYQNPMISYVMVFFAAPAAVV